VVRRRPALGAERRDVHQVGHAGAGRLLDDVARPLDVHPLERDRRRRLVDDADQVQHRVAPVGGAAQRFGGGHVTRPRLDLLGPGTGLPLGAPRQQAHAVAAAEQRPHRGLPDHARAAGHQDSHARAWCIDSARGRPVSPPPPVPARSSPPRAASRPCRASAAAG
jgi:hypothetical protein